MGRNNKRNIYDPTIVSRLADEHNASPAASVEDGGELYFEGGGSNRGGSRDTYDDGYMDETGERQLTSEILDPKLHGPHGVRSRAQQAKARRRRCLLLTSLLLVLAIVVAVICGVAVQKSKNSSSTSSASNPSSSDNPNAQSNGGPDHVQLPTPPSNLNEICTGTVQQNGGVVDSAALSDCKAACQPAKCCEIPSQFQSSCLRGNEDTCMTYHQECFVLEMDTYGGGDSNPFVLHESNVTVQPAPADLAQTCAMNALTSNEGTMACTEVCKPYECCYSTDVPSCADQQLCTGYSPCLNLKAHVTVDDTIQKEVDALCEFDKLKTSVDNRQQCNNACKLARCCFNDGCFAKPDGFCNQYKSCKNLYGKKSQQLQHLDDATYDDKYDDDDGVYDTADDKAYDDNGSQTLDDNSYMDDTKMKDDVAPGTPAVFGGTFNAPSANATDDGWDDNGQDDTYDDKYDDQYDDTVANRR